MRTLNTEIVFRGHHDKLADQLSDGILQHYLQYNQEADINIDVVGGEDTVFVTGNINNTDKIDITKPVKSILQDLNYNTDILIVDDSYQRKTSNQSNKATSVYGYATKETPIMLPKTMLMLQDIAKDYDKLCKTNPIFLPDGKVIMKGIYKNDKLMKISSINVNHQNTGENVELLKGTIYELIENVSKKHGVEIEEYKINPYGHYYKGGFNRDTGLTGSKLRMDSYQGLSSTTNLIASGKSIYGIRSAIYKTRDVAKTILLENNCEWCEVKADYEENAIVPYNITITTDKGIVKVDKDIYEDFEPENIIYDLELLNENFINLASYGQIQK